MAKVSTKRRQITDANTTQKKGNDDPSMRVVMKSISDLIPNARNARVHHDADLGGIAASIRAFGFRDPVEIDEDNNVIAGHGRIMAAMKLGMTEVPCIVGEKMSLADQMAYGIANNQTALRSEWNEELLGEQVRELANLGMDLEALAFTQEQLEEMFGAGEGEKSDVDNPYTQKIESPIYEPKGEQPRVKDLYDITKADKLLKEIDAAKIPEDIAAFLRFAAMRHVRFSFSKIAEFYCHARPEVQDLMEKSALIIIDYDKAIEHGFMKLVDDVEKERQDAEAVAA